jgi:hypothetical protein
VSITGTVANLSGTCPTLSFTVAGRSVATNAGTEYPTGSCNALRNGNDVTIDGDQQPSGTVIATRVQRLR